MSKTKLEALISQHKALTRAIADGNLKDNVVAKQSITGEIIALALADFKCEKCKANSELTIHHMISKGNKKFAPPNKYVSQRHYFFNIVILCVKCHVSMNGNKKNLIGAITKKNILRARDQTGMV